MATELVELRIPVPDRPGVLAEVTTLAGRLGVNVADVEIAHSPEGGRGVLVLVVAADRRRRVRGRAARPRLPPCRGPSWRERCPTSSRSAARAPLRGRLRLPGDKSISHRALLFAALGDRSQHASRTSRPAPTCTRRARALDAARRADPRPAPTAVTVQRHRARRAARAGRRARLRNSGTTMRVLSGRARGPAVPLGADRRRVAAPAADGAGSSSRCARWAPHIDGRDDGDARAARRSAAATLHGMRHELPVASAQVKTALMLAGLQADGRDRDRVARRRAATTPSGCSPRSARRSRSTACTVRVRGRRAGAVRARRARRSVVGRVLRRRAR